jgi:hypothetical protein
MVFSDFCVMETKSILLVEVEKLFHQLDGRLSVTVLRSEPDHNTNGSLVDLPHEYDLLTAFLKIALINGQSVDP